MNCDYTPSLLGTSPTIYRVLTRQFPRGIGNKAVNKINKNYRLRGICLPFTNRLEMTI